MNYKFEKPWEPIESDQETAILIHELEKEVNSSHILYNFKCIPIARRNDDDEVIFKVSDDSFAIVHLTWSGKQEKDKDFPFTEFFSNLKELSHTINRSE